MLVVGVDPSSKKIALVAYETITRSAYAQSHVLYKSGKQQPSHLGQAVGVMRSFVQWAESVAPSGEKVAWVEDPLVGRGGVRTTMVQAFVGGIIRGMLVDAGFTVHNVNVSTWRARLGIKAKGTTAIKADTRRYVVTAWPKVEGLIGSDADLADAAAICLFGQ